MTRPGVEAVRGSHRGTNCGWSQTVGRSTDPVGWHGSRIRAAPSTKRGCHRWSGSRAVGLRVRLSVSEDESRMGADRFTKRGFWQSARSADSRGIGSRRADPGIGTKRGFARIGSRRAEPAAGLGLMGIDEGWPLACQRTNRGSARIHHQSGSPASAGSADLRGSVHEARIGADPSPIALTPSSARSTDCANRLRAARIATMVTVNHPPCPRHPRAVSTA